MGKPVLIPDKPGHFILFKAIRKVFSPSAYPWRKTSWEDRTHAEI
jgi:hypothetical protein